VTIDDYYRAFKGIGYEPTGEGTNLTEEWVNAAAQRLYITRPSELSPQDRADAVERIRRTLGIGFPIYAQVH
jgi:hypothetical protein